MTLANVLEYKFPKVGGIVTKEGVLIEWPESLGPVPDQSTIDTWTVEYSAALQSQATAEAAQSADISAAKNYAKLNALKNMTPAQVQAWVAANVTNLSQAQDAIATLAIAVSILARRL